MSRGGGLGPVLARALRLRCPRCGGGPVFSGWWTMVDACPICGHRYEREQGYWVGAMIFNTALALMVFLVTLVGGLVVFWPDVPWTALNLGVVILTGLTPIVGYPLSKTLWVAYDLAVHPLEPREVAAARERVQGEPPSG